MSLQRLLLAFQNLLNFTLQFVLLLLETLRDVLQSHLHVLLHLCCCTHKVLADLVPGFVFLHKVRLEFGHFLIQSFYLSLVLLICVLDFFLELVQFVEG